MRYPSSIDIREVSPRDGLQGESVRLSTDDKVRLVDMLSAAGLRRINVSSFVSPRAVPQLADAEEVFARIARRPGVAYDASVPNARGVERAIAAKADGISIFVSASETANRNNVRRSVDESMREAESAIRTARQAGLFSVGTVATAFGSPYGETITADAVVALASRFVAAGATGVALGDTSGDATPRQVGDLVARLVAALPGIDISLHFHDTRGCGLANVLAAMDAGATRFDAAVGGIGGSPFTANSLGNISTEDLLHLCEGAGIGTGVDLDAILDVYRYLETKLDHPLPGKLGRLPRHDTAVTA